MEAVTELYRCLLDDTLALAYSLRDVKVAIMCPASDVEEIEQLAGGDTIVVPAGRGACGGSDLGVCAVRSAEREQSHCV